MMFDSCLHPVVCGRVCVLFTLFVFVYVYWRVFFLVCLRPVSFVDNIASFSGLSIVFNAPSVFSIYIILQCIYVYTHQITTNKSLPIKSVCSLTEV